MSPEKAKVFIVEDGQQWQNVIGEILTRGGHEVVLRARTKEEALAGIKKLEELDVNVVTLDGNLNEWDTSGADGQIIMSTIRTQTPDVKIIGLAGGNVRGADIDLGKSNAVDLCETVTKL